ncbi:hypothetical protein SPRG_10052, partial [Saprolegnia parasitica CBS 223.65]
VLQSGESDTSVSWAPVESDAASWEAHWATTAAEDGQYAAFTEAPLFEEAHASQQPWAEEPYGAPAEHTQEALHWSNPSASGTDVDDGSQSPEPARTAANESAGRIEPTPAHDRVTTPASSLLSDDAVDDATTKHASHETPLVQQSLATAQTLNQARVPSEKLKAPDTPVVAAPSTPDVAVDSFIL